MVFPVKMGIFKGKALGTRLQTDQGWGWGGGGGGTQQSLFWYAQPWSPTSYSVTYHFWAKRTILVNLPLTANAAYPFQIPTYKHCILYNCSNCLLIILIAETLSLFALFRAVRCVFFQLTLMKSNYTAEMTDSPTFLRTSTPEIPTP